MRFCKYYLRIMGPLALAYVAGALDAYWASVALLVVAQCAAIWVRGEE